LLLMIMVLPNLMTGVKSLDVPSDDILYQSFLNWMDQFNVAYTSQSILESKFITWKENIIFIANNNEQITTPDVEIEYNNQQTNMRSLLSMTPVETYPTLNSLQMSANSFSDLSNTEFLATHTGHIPGGSPVAVAAAGGPTLSTGVIVGVALSGTAFVSFLTAMAIYASKRMSGSNSKLKSDPTKTRSVPIITDPSSPVVFSVHASTPTTTTTPPTPSALGSNQPQVEDMEEIDLKDDKSPVRGGINVFDFSRNPRHSITARHITFDNISNNANQQPQSPV
ncbi:hypothetical protein SAMD00019534_072990, partial [Acytostelium subglobosum LB1]|uniref:hypothetical protein n=1 Tax=Acytostelium subglobosum LB1 TaxID=1410327 RepID=UPI0006449E69